MTETIKHYETSVSQRNTVWNATKVWWFPLQCRTAGRDAHPAASCRFPAASPGPAQKGQMLHVRARELMAPSGGCTCNGQECPPSSRLWSLWTLRQELQQWCPAASLATTAFYYLSPWHVTCLIITPQSPAYFKPLKMFWASLLAFPLKKKTNSVFHV